MKTYHWYAYPSELPYHSDVAVKLPTDPRTLIRVYRAAMRHRRALGTPVESGVAVVDFMRDFDNAMANEGKK